MADLEALPHGLDRDARTCLAVVECSQGGRIKYTYCSDFGGFELTRLLPAGLTFPLDFGFVPSTTAEDGDPLDIMIVNDEPIAMGAVAKVRLIGLIEAEQTEDGETVRNDRLIGVSTSALKFAEAVALSELGAAVVETVTNFWIHYEKLRGVQISIIGLRGAETACARVDALSRVDRVAV